MHPMVPNRLPEPPPSVRDGFYHDLMDGERIVGWMAPDAIGFRGFANDIDAIRPEETRAVAEADVVAGEAVPVVFGNDAYDYGWVENVRCAP